MTMKGEKSSQFYHRLNADGTIDSICLNCFLTAAKADIGSDLQELESAHQCDDKEPFILAENLRSLGRHL
jgi:hypothetical protein